MAAQFVCTYDKKVFFARRYVGTNKSPAGSPHPPRSRSAPSPLGKARYVRTGRMEGKGKKAQKKHRGGAFLRLFLFFILMLAFVLVFVLTLAFALIFALMFLFYGLR